MEAFARFGFPAQFVTDNATYFTSKLFQDNCVAVGVKHWGTITNHPQANITERVNRNLKAMLIAHTEEHKDWDAKLPGDCICHSYHGESFDWAHAALL